MYQNYKQFLNRCSILIAAILLITASGLMAQTNVSGHISSDSTWAIAGSPYIVKGDVYVNNGTVLIIEAGVDVKFDDDKFLQVNGTLIARGTSDNQITFTNNQSNWGYIFFSDSSTDASYDYNGDYIDGSILEYCIIENAGNLSISDNGALRINMAQPFLNYCTIQNNLASGIYAWDLTANLKIENSVFQNNTGLSGGGIYANGKTEAGSKSLTPATDRSLINVTISNSVFYNNSSTNNGGAINVGAGIHILSNSIVNKNSASGSGGGIYAADGFFTIYNNEICRNTAADSGGGIYSTTNTELINNSIVGNIAADAAAIAYQGQGQNFNGNTITENEATNGIPSSTLFIENHPSLNNNNIFNNSTSFELYNNNSSGSADLNATSNWWGTDNASQIQEIIYDQADDGTKGIVDYEPYLGLFNTDAPISPPIDVIKYTVGSGLFLHWSANSESDLSGYKIYYGSSTGYSYENVINVGNVTRYTVPGLSISDRIVITAYDSQVDGTDDQFEGHESWYSEDAEAITEYPDVAVSPAGLSFGNVIVTKSSDMTFTVSNEGNLTLNVSATQITGANSDQFSFVSGAGSFSLIAGGNRTIIVKFSPTSEGAKSSTLRIVCDDLDESPVNISLNGTGGIPDISTSEIELNYGNVVIPETSILGFSVSNKGNYDLAVSATEIIGENADQFSFESGEGSFSIPVGEETHPISVKFSPTSAGPKAATLRITSNDPYDSVVEIALRGTAVFPDISISPTELSFGKVRTSEDSVLNITVTNNGSYDLIVSTTTITGTNADLFSIVKGQAPFTVTLCGKSTIEIKFAPSLLDSVSATLQISSNDPYKSVVEIPLNGTGVIQDIEVSPAALDFRDVLVGDNSIMGIVVSNMGTADLVVNAAEIIGTNVDQFSVFSGQEGFTIETGARARSIAIKFQPASVGDKTATLRLTSNDPDENTIDISLSGIGGLQDIAVSADELIFGEINVSEDSTLNVLISNEGGSDLIVDSTKIIGTDADIFSIESGGGSFTISKDGDADSISIKFFPKSTGTKTATLQIFSNDPDENPVDISISGTAIQPMFPDITISKTELDFGNVVLSENFTMSISVGNKGNADLVVNTTTIGGTNSDQFSFLRGDGSFTIPVGGADIPIEIKFSPTATGFKTASFQISSNDPDKGPQEIRLTGVGIQESGAPEIVVSPTELIFGSVTISDDSTMSISVSNQGNADLVVMGTEFVGYNSDQFSFVVDEGGFTIPAGGAAHPIEIKFSPTSDGTKSAVLRITSNDPKKNPLDISLTGSGTGQSEELPDIVVLPSNLDFGNVIVPNQLVFSISVRNQGSADLVIDSTKIIGTDADFFSIESEDGSFIIPAGVDTNSITIKFSPSTEGLKSAVLRIFSNDPDEDTLDVLISGTGVTNVQEYLPNIAVVPTPLDFGDIVLSNHAVVSVAVHNTGSATLLANSTQIIGADAGQFSFESGDGSFSIPVGGNAYTIKIKFSPLSVGQKYASLLIISNDPDESSLLIPMSGTGTDNSPTQPDIVVSASTLNFGEVFPNNYSERSVSVTNNGNADLNVTGTQITGTDANLFLITGGQGSFIIPAGGAEYPINIKFSPTAIGSKTAALQINSNDPDESTTVVTLSGRCVNYSNPADIVVSDTAFNFGNIYIDEDSVFNIKVKNVGGSDLFLYSIDMLDTNVTQIYRVNEPDSIITLVDGDTCDIEIGFSPNLEGLFLDTLRIINNDPQDDTLDIVLTGTGILDNTPAHFMDVTISPTLNIDCNFGINIFDDETEIQSAKLYYRKGGQTAYLELELTQEQNNSLRWSSSIPGLRVKEQGLEYYVEAFHGGMVSTYPNEDPEKPEISEVIVPFIEFPQVTLQNLYQMFSIPLNTNNQPISIMLGDDLGEYNRNNYRIFDWDAVQNRYTELSALDTQLPPGKALWLITKEQITIDIDSSYSVSTSEDYPIQLHEGWNMIGVPFAFNVAWSEVDASSIQGAALNYFNGASWEMATIMEPFKGYAIKSVRDTTLYIPPIEAVTLNKLYTHIQPGAAEWQIQLKAQSENLEDIFNFAGVRGTANDGWDILDSAEPPAIDDYVSIYFDHSDWEKYAGPYTSDFREPYAEGYVFEFTVQTSLSDQIKITFEPQNLPQNFDWIIVSPQAGVKHSKGEILTSLPKQKFCLIVGTAEFLNSKQGDLKELPTKFDLSQNHPNPFNPQTTIRYTMPKAEKVTLKVFNLLGEEVVTLINGELKAAGYYDIDWNGLDKHGRQVASGIYLYQVRAGDFSAIKRMVVMK